LFFSNVCIDCWRMKPVLHAVYCNQLRTFSGFARMRCWFYDSENKDVDVFSMQAPKINCSQYCIHSFFLGWSSFNCFAKFHWKCCQDQVWLFGKNQTFVIAISSSSLHLKAAVYILRIGVRYWKFHAPHAELWNLHSRSFDWNRCFQGRAFQRSWWN
jgi:hypothetical protein